MLVELEHLALYTNLMEFFVLSEHCLNLINFVLAHRKINVKESVDSILTLKEAAFYIWVNTLEEKKKKTQERINKVVYMHMK